LIPTLRTNFQDHFSIDFDLSLCYVLYRWDLNCNVDQWDVIRDIARTNHEDTDDNEGNLDVLLKTLWEGEDEIVSRLHCTQIVKYRLDCVAGNKELQCTSIDIQQYILRIKEPLTLCFIVITQRDNLGKTEKL
jgi:hypothetical protein